MFPESYVELADAGAGDSDDWDEEGDEEWDEHAAQSGAVAPMASQDSHESHDHMESSTDYAAPAGHAGAGGTIGRGTLRKSVNRYYFLCWGLMCRFSGFVKAGAESYMIGGLKELTIDPLKLIHLQVLSLLRSHCADDGRGTCVGAQP